MNTQTNRTLTAALALALAVGLSACGGEGDAGDGVNPQTPTATQPAEETGAESTTEDTTTDDTSTDATTEDEQTSATDAGDLTATALLAIGTAEQETGGTAYEIDDQDDDGTWEVDVAVDGRSVEVTVSADGTSVVGTEDDDLDDEDKAGLDAATITLQDAIQVAIDEVGGVLDDAELETKGGQHYWEVEVDRTDAGADDVEVKVSVDGKVLSVDG